MLLRILPVYNILVLSSLPSWLEGHTGECKEGGKKKTKIPKNPKKKKKEKKKKKTPKNPKKKKKKKKPRINRVSPENEDFHTFTL
jgi:hypothetical protein